MHQAYKYRIYPTSEQQLALAKSFGCCRWFWNYSLNLCHETYKNTGKSLSRAAIQKMLPQLKKEHEWLKTDTYSQCLQVVALNLSTAYKNFFDRQAKLPKFKSKKGRQSITYPQNVKFQDNYIKLPKIGLVYYRRHRDFSGEIKTVTVSVNPDGKYFVSVLVEDDLVNPEKPAEGKAIGIDLGLTHFCVTSDGSKYQNPKNIAKYTLNLKRKQHKLARKQKGSNTRNKARIKIARLQGKIARCREDFLHKLSRAAVATTGGTPATRCLKIVNENQVIAVENLAIKKRCDPASAKDAPGSAYHNLAASIGDCAWGMFETMLSYKAEREGRIYIEVDRFLPYSQTCNICLNQVGSLSLNVKNWTCEHCHTTHNREINAAINIKNEALRILRVRNLPLHDKCQMHSKQELGISSTANLRECKSPGKTSVLLDAIPSEDGNLSYSNSYSIG
ncbi:MAG: transposase [Okeania sp. SIO2G4]|uniref:RNA-guided endonuclease InsQ/TnpB family protein n=1 Tax=unclassified Okeania TaxID=2634635 RepID=UPI0013B7DC81|nr:MULTISPECIES: RNA-guided endonuclease TnpB family protein [unclassified Okeania]NEP42369.1 transposase [Okeania sp. SIO2H7]NEP75739.1 transposase [Okeania sp. SIO2G5]NEP96889.1 transposase [Okeania sp. SIO2F5]NEQ94572.1 transposase [Okeania sp. SIO2G4]